jgi:hypothetical protein
MDFVSHYLFPKIVQTDRGPEFTADVAQAFFRAAVDKVQSTTYHPQSQAVVERFNRTMTDMLDKHVLSCQEDWFQYLGQIQVEYNTHPHTVTGYSPYYLVFGQNLSLAETVLLDANREPIAKSIWEDNLRIAATRLRRAYQKEAEKWNAHIKWSKRVFQPEDVVLVWKVPPKTDLNKGIHRKLI